MRGPEAYLTPFDGRMFRVPSGYLRQLSGTMLIPGDCLSVLDCIGQGTLVWRRVSWCVQSAQVMASGQNDA